VAFDAVGAKAIDDLAQVVDDGGTIINFGPLGIWVRSGSIKPVKESLWVPLED
jgi:hypothetical protein